VDNVVAEERRSRGAERGT